MTEPFNWEDKEMKDRVKWSCCECGCVYLGADTHTSDGSILCPRCETENIRKYSDQRLRRAGLQELKVEDYDPVDKPKHYQDALLGHEAIDVIEDLLKKYKGRISEEQCYLLGNAMKYILRAHSKGTMTVDFSKSLWYMKRMVNGFNNLEV